MQTHSVSGTVADRYAALVDFGHVLTGILRPADLYEAVGARLARAIALDSLFISTLDPAGQSASVVYRTDARGSVSRNGSYPADRCMAIRERRPVLHLPGDPAAVCSALGLDARNRPAISSPILRNGNVAGVLTVLGPAGAMFDTGDLEFVAAASDMLAAALPAPGENGRAAADELAALDQICRALAGLSMDDAMERATRSVHDALGADGTALWLVRSGGEVEVAHSAGAFCPRRGEKLALSHDLFRELAGKTAPIPFDHRPSSPNGSTEFRRLARAGTGLIVPLHAQDRVLGAMIVTWREPHEVTPPTFAALTRFTALAAVAAGYARLHDQINALSLIDPLTGTPNRRQLAMYLEKEFAAARRGRKLTVLLFDIDDFQQFNKTNGRQAGDAVLRAFGEMLVGQTRAMNLAARFEDDAFIVALADADRRAGFIHASRIARAAENHPLIGPSGIHASVGIASYAPRMKSFEDLIAAAQKDLEARRTGGGRLTI